MIVIGFFQLRVIVIIIVTGIFLFRVIVIVIVIGIFSRVTRERDRDCDEALVSNHLRKIETFKKTWKHKKMSRTLLLFETFFFLVNTG